MENAETYLRLNWRLPWEPELAAKSSINSQRSLDWQWDEAAWGPVPGAQEAMARLKWLRVEKDSVAPCRTYLTGT